MCTEMPLFINFNLVYEICVYNKFLMNYKDIFFRCFLHALKIFLVSYKIDRNSLNFCFLTQKLVITFNCMKVL